MDLRNLETTTTLAIEGVYKEYWNMIPEKYKLLEKAQRTEHGNYEMDYYENLPEHQKPKVQKSKPLTYKDVEKADEPKQEPTVIQDNAFDYTWYCTELEKRDQYFDLQPFFDPQLDFENRLHYKLVGVEYPKRKNPWFIITWNMGNGILKSSLTNRRFDTAEVKTPGGAHVKFDFIDTELDVNLCFNSNSLQALVELQENIRVNRREKFVIDSRLHSILGRFPISVSLIETGNIAKATKDKSTLCTLTVTIRIDYPVIGNVRENKDGIIKVIRANDYRMDEDPQTQDLIGKDVILPDDEKILQELLDQGAITEEDLKYNEFLNS